MIAAGSRADHLGRRDAVRHDLGVHVELADPAGDQLGVLGAEVDDENGPPGGRARQAAFKTPMVDRAGG